MGWIKATEKQADGFKLARLVGTEKSFPAMFAPQVIAGADGKTYKKEDIEWFDVSSRTFGIDDMQNAYKSGQIYGFEKCGQGSSNETFEKLMKEQYKIDL